MKLQKFWVYGISWVRANFFSTREPSLLSLRYHLLYLRKKANESHVRMKRKTTRKLNHCVLIKRTEDKSRIKGMKKQPVRRKSIFKEREVSVIEKWIKTASNGTMCVRFGDVSVSKNNDIIKRIFNLDQSTLASLFQSGASSLQGPHHGA